MKLFPFHLHNENTVCCNWQFHCFCMFLFWLLWFCYDVISQVWVVAANWCGHALYVCINVEKIDKPCDTRCIVTVLCNRYGIVWQTGRNHINTRWKTWLPVVRIIIRWMTFLQPKKKKKCFNWYKCFQNLINVLAHDQMKDTLYVEKFEDFWSEFFYIFNKKMSCNNLSLFTKI